MAVITQEKRKKLATIALGVGVLWEFSKGFVSVGLPSNTAVGHGVFFLALGSMRGRKK